MTRSIHRAPSRRARLRKHLRLFVRLAPALFRPIKSFRCSQCGLTRHDPDALHCNACGHILDIPDEGR